MIQLSALSKSFGDRVLLDSVTWQIDDRERVGLSGPNGAGKTTLLKMLAGLEEPDGGTIVKPAGLTIGYLPQDGLSCSGRSLREEASLAFKPLLDMRAEIAALEERLGEDASQAEHEAMLTRYAELQDEFRRGDGYAIDLKVTTVLRGLGFTEDDMEKATDTFSGGWQMRIALARLLLGRPGLLLLDEPTNHLDLDARNWLEEYLLDYPHAVILVSHDRYFLDAVVTRIAEIGLRTLTDYHGNYTAFEKERDARAERLRQMKRDQDEEIERMRAFINRFRYQATKAAQVQSRIKMLDRIVPIEIPPERRRVHFHFPVCRKSGRMVLELQHARKAYDGRAIFADLSLHIERGDRIALLGPNGVGKSTLMRMLSGTEAPDAGRRVEGHQLVTQYFAQDEATRLDPALTVYQTLAGDAPMDMVPHIRTILGGFLFSGDDIEKPVRVLSGGERTRLAVARMLLRPANTLLLDEPTNHLDLDSKDVLLEALEDFGGTLIFVSHDRYFVDRLATKVIEIGGGDAFVYPGTYEEYLWSRKNRATGGSKAEVGGSRAQVGSRRAAGNSGGEADSTRKVRGMGSAQASVRPSTIESRASNPQPPTSNLKPPTSNLQPRASNLQPPTSNLQPRASNLQPRASNLQPRASNLQPRASNLQPRASNLQPPTSNLSHPSYDEKKRADAEARKARKEADARDRRIQDLEARIAEREEEVKALERQMSAPGFYENHDASRPVIDRHQTLMWEVGDLMNQWEALSSNTKL